MSNIIKIKINNEEYEIDLEEDSNINITSIFSNSLKVEALTTDKIDGEGIVTDNIYSDSTNKVYVSSSSGEGDFKTLKITPSFTSYNYSIYSLECTRRSYQSADELTAFAISWTFVMSSSSHETSYPMNVGSWYLVSESVNSDTLTTNSTTTYGLAYCYKNVNESGSYISYAVFIGLPDYINDDAAKTMYIINFAYNGGAISLPSSFSSTVSYT